MIKNEENNGTEEIGLVTPTPGPGVDLNYMHIDALALDADKTYRWLSARKT